MSTLLCPSDTPSRDNATILGSANPAPDNYVANAGWPSYATGFHGERQTPGRFNGMISLVNPSQPASWHIRRPTTLGRVPDGTSNTVLLSERIGQTGNSSDQIDNGDERLKSRHILERFETLGEIGDQLVPSLHSHTFESAFIGRSWISGFTMTAPTYLHVKTPNTLIGHYNTSQDEGDFVMTPSSHHSSGVNIVRADGSTKFISNQVDQEVWWAVGGRDDGRTETFSN